ncbi:MAG: 50S ribosome-binding GTPase [Candidatus Omnitrophica bacterium]|nr:50S ribosome-binding GTPase [Candidatus Omnitrophota bacterium]
METLTFVIVGHIDHGKSTLIGRLLYDTNSLSGDKIDEIKKTSKDLGRQTEFAYLLDHLEEERQQGITIETTQVFFNTDKRKYVIIDAPGHVEFVKNMITGASHAEAAVLIIDAKEGVKQQTKRHAYILSLLGIKQVITLINKLDLTGYEQKVFDSLVEEISIFFKTIGLSCSYFIPCSALSGENIVQKGQKAVFYQGPSFLEALDSLESRPKLSSAELIFPVQDVYKNNDKRIIAGRLESGKLCQGQHIKIMPHEQVTSITAIEKFPGNIACAQPGESIGITTADSVFSDRGDIICAKDSRLQFQNVFSANIIWLSKRNFLKDEKLTIKCSTQSTPCKISRIIKKIDSSTLEVIKEDAQDLKNLEVATVEIQTKKPIAIKNFDDIQELGRFVLVRDENTCAGGIVTSL